MSIKKVLFGTFLSLALVATSISAPVFAKDACEVAEIDDLLICGTAHSNEEAELQNRVKNTLNTVYLWIGIIAVIVIIIGGIKYMTSADNPEKVKGAKNAIIYAVIGLVVTLMAFAITNLVINALDGKEPQTTSDGGGRGGSGSGGGGWQFV